MISLDELEADSPEYSQARREVLPPPQYFDEIEACRFNLISGILYDVENSDFWSEEFVNIIPSFLSV